jgi:hypothetical protein
MEDASASDDGTPSVSTSLLGDSGIVGTGSLASFATSWGDFGGGTGDTFSCLDSADGGDGHAVPEKYI